MPAVAETTFVPPLLELCGVLLAAQRPAPASAESIDWRVTAEDYWVVGGLPASGKSDLLATAAGLQRPAQGRHFLFGQETDHLGEEELLRERLRVGLVFADGGRLFNQFTVAENVALPLCYHHNCPAAEVWEPVQAILELTGLTSLAHNTPGVIGRSWRQRVGLARALALKPELLLLDNPVAGLDPRQTRWWLDLLATLSAGHPFMEGKKVTLVVTAGDLRPWVEHGRQFALLQQNCFVPLGDKAELSVSVEPLLRELLATETIHLKR